MKQLFLFLLIAPYFVIAQNPTGSLKFWDSIKSHCGKAYEGTITAGGKEGDGFVGEKLVMHVRNCEDRTIRIPFFVGEDKSRTWVLSLKEDNRILLKHDHRHKDGSEEELTQYGGVSTNTGLPNIQFFPADEHTSNLIPLASTNVWWFTIDETSLTYNLRRIGSDRLFTVKFDLTAEIATPEAPW
ncbi:hypothetical protein O4H26_06155 [Aequorivita viscosa]|nr:hypothetical protein [Aequorivita viscosa]